MWFVKTWLLWKRFVMLVTLASLFTNFATTANPSAFVEETSCWVGNLFLLAPYVSGALKKSEGGLWERKWRANVHVFLVNTQKLNSHFLVCLFSQVSTNVPLISAGRLDISPMSLLLRPRSVKSEKKQQKKKILCNEKSNIYNMTSTLHCMGYKRYLLMHLLYSLY